MKYVIWSFKHRLWWGSQRAGYTMRLSEAGRYSAQEAGEIVTDSTFAENAAIMENIASDFGPPTVAGLWDRRFEEDSDE